jgi:hypothetical protein
MSTKVRIPNPEVIGYSIVSLYEVVAQALGEKNWNAENIQFDCTKINVAKNIYNAMEASAVEEFGCKHRAKDIKTEFAMLWCMSGPKAIDGLANNEVEVEEGFISFN